MNLQRCPDPSAFARLNYVHVLQSWRNIEATAAHAVALRATKAGS
jgi:hypothetical protein